MQYFSNLGFEETLLQARYAYSGTSVQYIGYAQPGAAETEAEWVIVKFTYNASSLVTKKTFANGSKAFNCAWSDREGYSYA